MARFDMSLRVSFLTVFVLVFLSSGWTGSSAEPNITFYAKGKKNGSEIENVSQIFYPKGCVKSVIAWEID